MITLFNLNHHEISTKNYSSLLHDKVVLELEKTIADYVGAKYAVALNSATNAIFLSLIGHHTTVSIPSILPPVVANAIVTAGSKIMFYDDIDWVGDSYVLHRFKDYKIVDSAQKLEKNQFTKECDPQDLMIFSFYPTKPVGSCDGGMIVSDDFNKIRFFKELSLNGMTFSENNWDRTIKYAGYKFYMNSIQADIAHRNFQTYESKLKRLKIVREIYNEAFGLSNTSNHLYRIRVDDNYRFIKHMKQRNIQCGIHYKALHEETLYRLYCENIDTNLTKSTTEARSTVSIPYHENLTNEDINQVISGLMNYDKYSGI